MELLHKVTVRDKYLELRFKRLDVFLGKSFVLTFLGQKESEIFLIFYMKSEQHAVSKLT